jgi:hypothetical protein
MHQEEPGGSAGDPVGEREWGEGTRKRINTHCTYFAIIHVLELTFTLLSGFAVCGKFYVHVINSKIFHHLTESVGLVGEEGSARDRGARTGSC